jgi:hypothetical protein
MRAVALLSLWCVATVAAARTAAAQTTPPPSAPPASAPAPEAAAPVVPPPAPAAPVAPAAPEPASQGPPPLYQGPPPLPPPASGGHAHDGFYARAQLGAAATTFKLDDVPGSFSSGGGALSIALGGALTPHVILFGEIFGASADRFDAPGAPAVTMATPQPGAAVDTKAGASVMGLGVGAAYCFMPANVCLAGTLASVSVGFKGVLATGRTKSNSDPAGALKLAVSKEWWIANDFGLGLAFQYLTTGAMHDSAAYANVEKPVWRATGFALVGSVTYN